MAHRFEDIQSYEDLEARLQEWHSFIDDVGYDFCGMVHLLGACLDNLRENASEADLNDIGNYLSEERKAFLIKLAEAAQLPGDED